MARKKGAEKDSRAALIDAALEEMAERGYEGASVEAIARRAGLSKGTFFHFFPAKLELLDAACERIAERNWAALRPMLEEEGDPLERLAHFLCAARRWRVAHAAELTELWGELAQESHARLRTRIRARQQELVAPTLCRLLTEGNAAHRFQVSDPQATAVLLLEMTAASSDGTLRVLRSGSPHAVELAVRRVNATTEALERVLGAATGSLERVSADLIEPFVPSPSLHPRR